MTHSLMVVAFPIQSSIGLEFIQDYGGPCDDPILDDSNESVLLPIWHCLHEAIAVLVNSSDHPAALVY